MNNNLINQLKERGLIAQITDEKKISELLINKKISLYCGFDPTADSLHLGHLIPLLCLRHFQLNGHKPVVLLGGATGLIGDPSFKKNMRKLNNEEIIQKWINKISKQIELFLDFNCGENSAIITNNYNWFCDMNVLTFLRNIGKYFSINKMINKESIKNRLNNQKCSISFTEFSYSLLQGYDYFHLNKIHNVILQIGGSDQWGNIISGINLIQRLCKKKVFGLTVTLITKSDGIKFGKTENDTIWLDPNRTSPYKFYQFWINIPDVDIYRFLKYFTFIDINDISLLEEKDKNDTSNNIPKAKYILAEQMTRLVHGNAGLASAKRITDNLFCGNLYKLHEEDFNHLIQDGIPKIEIKKNTNLIEALVASGLQSSRREARASITSNAITINGKKLSKYGYCFAKEDYLFGRFTILGRGKKSFCLICWK